MRYLSSRDHGYRIGNSASRTTIPSAVDDSKVIQEKTLNGYAKESHSGIEFFSNYGFTNVVQPPTGEGDKTQTAEAVTVYLGSNRSHGVVVANGDRRFRLFKLENGETAMHDDQGHQIVMHRDGIYASAPNSKKVVMQIMQDDKLPQDGVEATNGQKLGQTKQKGKATVATIVLDKNALTITHAKAIAFNCETFTVNASSNIKLISGAYALVKGAAAAILYSTSTIYMKATAAIHARSQANFVDPPWDGGAQEPPISS